MRFSLAPFRPDYKLLEAADWCYGAVTRRNNNECCWRSSAEGCPGECDIVIGTILNWETMLCDGPMLFFVFPNNICSPLGQRCKFNNLYLYVYNGNHMNWMTSWEQQRGKLQKFPNKGISFFFSCFSFMKLCKKQNQFIEEERVKDQFQLVGAFRSGQG